jgi:hypothetical protein
MRPLRLMLSIGKLAILAIIYLQLLLMILLRRRRLFH